METIEDLVTLNDVIEDLKVGVINRHALEILERLGEVILDGDLCDTFKANELESFCR